MTLILGARCTDGVVLVRDTKFIIDRGIDLIFRTYNEILFKFAGMSGTFELFQLIMGVLLKQNINNPFVSVGKLILEASDITKRLWALSPKTERK